MLCSCLLPVVALSLTVRLLLVWKCWPCNIKHSDLREEAGSTSNQYNLSSHLPVTGPQEGEIKPDKNGFFLPFSGFQLWFVTVCTLTALFSTWALHREESLGWCLRLISDGGCESSEPEGCLPCLNTWARHRMSNVEKTFCVFPCATPGEVFSWFQSKIRRNEETSHLSISPHSQWHLRYAYLR